MDITEAVRAAKQGQVQFKTDKGGIVHAGVGKVSFKLEQLEENIAYDMSQFYSSNNLTSEYD
jgi:large subunit ribosomal protein L1